MLRTCRCASVVRPWIDLFDRKEFGDQPEGLGGDRSTKSLRAYFVGDRSIECHWHHMVQPARLHRLGRAYAYLLWLADCGRLYALCVPVGNALACLAPVSISMRWLRRTAGRPASSRGAVTLFYVVSALLLIPVGSGIKRYGPRPIIALGESPWPAVLLRLATQLRHGKHISPFCSWASAGPAFLPLLWRQLCAMVR